MDYLIILCVLAIVFLMDYSIFKKTGKKYNYWYRGASGTRDETYFDKIMDVLRTFMFAGFILGWIAIILYGIIRIVFGSLK